MGETKKSVELSEKHQQETAATAKDLQKVTEKLIAETKEKNGYLVVSDDHGNIKRLPAKDL